MSYYEYRESQNIAARDHGFYALIMAAMRKADSENVAKLRAAFPEVWAELGQRSHAPGGFLDMREAALAGGRHPKATVR